VATVLPWGESIAVLMELGFPTDEFKLDISQLNGTDVLDGQLIGEDVAEYTQQVTINRGRQDQLAVVSAGNCSVTLLNNDRRFDPTNEFSPYWDSTLEQSGVTPRKKVTIIVGGETVFVGSITDIGLSYATGNSTDISTVVINAADDFVLLANAYTQQDRTPVEELTGSRMNFLLALPEVDYQGSTSISTGTVAVGAYPLNSNTNALAYAQAIADAEQGVFFVARDGILTFTDRVSAQFVFSTLSFSDLQGTGIQYQTLGVEYGQEFLYNKVVVSREGGVAQIANDSVSQAEYGISTLSLSGLLLASDTDASTLADNLLDLYAEPQFRFTDMGVLVSGQDAFNRQGLNSLEIGDTITVERNYATGFPTNLLKEQTVERLSRTITPNFDRLTVSLSDAYIVYAFILDDATFGRMDEDNALS
jgi:hypothetical protein